MGSNLYSPKFTALIVVSSAITSGANINNHNWNTKPLIESNNHNWNTEPLIESNLSIIHLRTVSRRDGIPSAGFLRSDPRGLPAALALRPGLSSSSSE